MKVGDVVLGKYRIDRELGRGGMGVVVAATNLDIDQHVALKLLLPERRGDDRAVARIMEEARATVRLSGLHTGKVLDVARLPSGEPVLVMALLEGETVAELLAREGALPDSRVIDLMLQACDGLAEAHALGIIHRDIKPSNLFLAAEVDGSSLLKVIDFGIAKASGDASGLTETQAVVGSVHYMSPEQLRKRPVDARTDIWSLGVVMYELLMGARPFPAESITDASIQIAVEQPPAMSSKISARTRAIVLRCLEKDPARRYASIGELAAALRGLSAGTASARSAATWRGARPGRSWRWPLVALVGALAAVTVLVAIRGMRETGDDAAARPPVAPAAPASPTAPVAPVAAMAAAAPHAPPRAKLQFLGCRPAMLPLPYFRPLVAEARDGAGGGTPVARDESKGQDRIVTPPNQEGGAFASLTGTGDISSGFDDDNIYGGLLGNEAGEMSGGFGYGRSGFGPGGGGTGWGTIGTGRYGTIGHGSGTGQGYGVANGRGGMRGRTATVPTVSIGQPSAEGDLDKAIIRRYIKRNIQRIQYCYEKQLLAKPTLAGTVQAQFLITPNGTVGASAGSGVDPEVASCVAEVIKNIEFPKPKGGGAVQVTYPFIFHQSGGEAPVGPPPRAPDRALVAHGQWTPYATISSKAGHAVAVSVADATTTAVSARLAAIEACFPVEATAALRAMVVVKADGATALRVGGVGDPAIEACVENALAGVTVATSQAHPDVEVACDARHGDDATWRVSLSAAYTIVEVTKTSFRRDRDAWAFEDLRAKHKDLTPWRALPAGGLYLVTVDADAPMSNLVVVLELIRATRQSVVVAVRVGPDAPRFAFAIDDGAPDPPGAHHLALQIAAHQLTVCSTTVAAPDAPLADPAAIDAALAAGAAGCKDRACATADVLAAGEVSATELIAVTGRIHHAGIEQVRFVQQRAACVHPPRAGHQP